MTIQQALDNAKAALAKLVTHLAAKNNIPETEAKAALASPEGMTGFIAKIETPVAAAPVKADEKKDEEKKDGKDGKDGDSKAEDKDEEKAEDKDEEKNSEKEDTKALLQKLRAEMTADFEAKIEKAMKTAASKGAVEIAAQAGLTPPAKADVAGTGAPAAANTPKGVARMSAAIRSQGIIGDPRNKD